MVTITIDTNKDSAEDIKKVISLLRSFAGERNSGLVEDNDTPVVSEGAFNIFNTETDIKTTNIPDLEDSDDDDDTDLNIKPIFY